MRKTSLSITAIITIAITAQPATAQTGNLHNLQQIDRQLAEFTGANIGQPGGARMQVDRKMKLAACSRPLLLEWYGTRQSAVKVSCPVPGSWRIFVPINTIHTSSQPVITRQAIVSVEAGGQGFMITSRGEAMQAGHLGDWIKIKIDDGSRQGRIVSAQIISSGRARIPIR